MGTRYKGTPAEVRGLDVFIKLTRATHAMLTRLEPNITRHGITGTQFGLLEALLHVGPLNQRELGEKMLMSKGNISIVVSNLAKQGLVKRVPDTSDRRRTVIHLTPAGRKLIAKIFPEQVKAILAEFSVLSAPEQDTLAALMKKLGRVE